jgi:hypothetical protein
MAPSSKRDDLVNVIVAQIRAGDKDALDYASDSLLFSVYSTEIFAEFGLDLCGYVFRQSRTSVLLTIKVIESGVPLVAFVSRATTRGCIEQMFDLLYEGKLKWQKDKYPWI